MLSYLALWSRGNHYSRSNPLASLLFFEPFAGTTAQLAISHVRELEADRLREETIGSGRTLANALRKFESANKLISLPIRDSQRNMFTVEALTTSGFSKLFMTHPAEGLIRRLLEIKETGSVD